MNTLQAVAAEARSGPRTPRRTRWSSRLRAAFSRSPPFTTSLCLHLAVLTVLAAWFVRIEPVTRPRVDLSFIDVVADTQGDDGVDLEPLAAGDAETDTVPEAEPEPTPDIEVTEPQPVDEPATLRPDPEQPLDTASDSVDDHTPPQVVRLLDGRDEGRRAALLAAHGGTGETEAAVARALEWLVKQQDKSDGLWSLQGPYVDGGSLENRLAATAMALLAFQGAGTTTQGGAHRSSVLRAWRTLLKKQLPDGRFDLAPMPHQHAMYAHAQATIALCELLGMLRARDATPVSIREFDLAARRAVDFAVAAQGPQGGWRYVPGDEGDMSVTGWYLMALKSAEMAGLVVPPETWTRLQDFLDLVAVDGGTRYGYRVQANYRPSVTTAVSAEGLLCRQYLGWPRREPRLIAGVELLLAAGSPDFSGLAEKDVYAWYYVTQVVHHFGGEPWERWNARLREMLPAGQVRKGPHTGSWDPARDTWGHVGGRLFTTCFCTWMLEVYYRHLPLYRDAAR
jgi:hypothetical protein